MPLYQSTRGQIACAEHAPLNDAARWRVEQWDRVAAAELTGPNAPRCQRCAAEPGAAHRPTERKPLVLNVDDRPASQYARERALRLNGFAVVNAGTAAAAIDAAQRLRPSLVLLDVHLPDGDGRDVCRQIKADATLGGIPVVLISSTFKGHVDNLEGLRWGGADGYVMEPCDVGALVSTLRSVLSSAP